MTKIKAYTSEYAEQAVAYLTDCTLATVSRMAMLRSKRKGEYLRQISIAQKGCDFMKEIGIPPDGTRVEQVNECGGVVSEWANKFQT